MQSSRGEIFHVWLPRRRNVVFGRKYKSLTECASVQRARRLRTRAQNVRRVLEAIVERNRLIEQERCGTRILLRRLGAPALLFVSDECRTFVSHD